MACELQVEQMQLRMQNTLAEAARRVAAFEADAAKKAAEYHEAMQSAQWQNERMARRLQVIRSFVTSCVLHVTVVHILANPLAY